MGESRKRLLSTLDARPKSEQELIAEWLYKHVSGSQFNAELSSWSKGPSHAKTGTYIVVEVIAGSVAEGDALLLDTRENGTKVVRVTELIKATGAESRAIGVGDLIGLTLGGVLVKEANESTRLRRFGVLPQKAKPVKKAKSHAKPKA